MQVWPPFRNTRDKTLKSILVQVTYFHSGLYMAYADPEWRRQEQLIFMLSINRAC